MGSDKMNYEPPAEWAEEVISHLIDIFPELERDIDNEDYFHDSPHLVFEGVLLPWTRRWIEKKRRKKIRQLADLLEEMILCADNKYTPNVVEVSYLEPLVLADSDLISELLPYLHKNTLKSLQYWQERDGSQPDG